MKADSSDILTYINNNKRIYEVPPYQRNYTWDRKQCKKLFNDLVFCQDRKKKHFLGTVVLMPSPKTENTYNYYEIIDGQQRFITLMLLLKALAEKDLSDADEIKKTYLFSEGDCEHDKLKLLPTKDDEKSFKDILYNRFDNKFKNQRLIKNYNFFQRSIHESDISPKDLYLALKKFEIVYIELGDQPEDENPQLVFESLNSTGARLKPIDLVRNYLLMSFKNPGLQRSAYKDYWVGLTKKFKENELSIFLRYYLVLKSHRKVRESQIYEEYKNFFESKRIKPDEAMEDLSQYADICFALQKCKLSLGNKKEKSQVNFLAYCINKMNTKAVYPYFMLLIRLCQSQRLEVSTVIQLLTELVSLCFRMKFCKVGTNSLDKYTAQLCNIYYPNGHLMSAKDIKYNEDREIYKHMPTDKQMCDCAQRNNLYAKGDQAEFAKLTLMILEHHESKENVDYEDKKITVDHILPQNTDRWQKSLPDAKKIEHEKGDSLGNLTLTGYNPDMSNKPYEDKKKYYLSDKTGITISRELAKEYPKWNEQNIIDRGNKLVKKLIVIFKMPDKPAEYVKTTLLDKGNISLTDDKANVTGIKPRKLRINEDSTIRIVNSWGNILQDVLNFAILKNKNTLTLIRKYGSNRLKSKVFPVAIKYNYKTIKTNGKKLRINTHDSAQRNFAAIQDLARLCSITGKIYY